MRLSFEYKGTKINYFLSYKKTSAIAINVDLKGQVNVTAPLGTTVHTVMDKVKGNAPWIINEVSRLQGGKQENKLADQYTYLGKKYAVEVVHNKELELIDVKLARGKFIIQTPHDRQKEMRQALLSWYKDKIALKLKERLKIYKAFFEVGPSEILVGDDSAVLFQVDNERVFANFAVGMVPVHIMDYMLVSGLCNLNYSNEEEKNIKRLEEILPEYKEAREWLDKNKAHLLI